jgi:hypothetical protein
MNETVQTDHEEVMELDKRFSTHEAICSERWKTVFNQLETIDARAGKRFDTVEESVTRIETIMISIAATGLLAGGGLLVSFFTMLP